eukprot:gene11177-13015_t
MSIITAASYSSPGAFNFTVPPGIFSLTVTLNGASGGPSNTANYNALGGSGISIFAVFSVTPGEILQIRVGGRGTKGGAAGYNGGGGNGGAVDGSSSSTSTGGSGNFYEGSGGTGVGGGAGGNTCPAGSLGKGADCCAAAPGGAGGGGRFGGGAGSASGGGGGSSYGINGVTSMGQAAEGDGYAQIDYELTPTANPSTPPTRNPSLIGRKDSNIAALVLDASLETLRGYYYTTPKATSIYFLRVTSLPGYFSSYVAGTCVDSANSAKNNIIAGRIRMDNGAMGAEERIKVLALVCTHTFCV